MNASEALKTKYVGFGDNGESLLAFTTEQVKFLESALTELEEIKKRAEEKRAEIINSLKKLDEPGSSFETQRFYRPIDLARKGLIDFIINGPKEGEGK